MAFETNRFCWQGCITTDTEAAKRFYTSALGLAVQTMPMGDGEATMLSAAEVPFAHLGEPQTEGVPSHWSNYLRVDDVDASTAKAKANGGTVLAEPMDIPPGRFSVVASPSGATFHLFHEADPATSSHHPGGAGSVHWVELHSTDLDADLSWLKKTFGYTTQQMQMPDGPYTLLLDGEEMRGGAMAAKSGTPSMWLTWLHVGDVDATVESVGSHGGQTIAPIFDAPGVGRMAIVADPTGGVFGVITPAA